MGNKILYLVLRVMGWVVIRDSVEVGPNLRNAGVEVEVRKIWLRRDRRR